MAFGRRFYTTQFNNSSNLARSASPRRFLAMMVPSLSSKTVWGIELTAYSFPASQAHPFRSETCAQLRPSSAMACSHLSRSVSKDTPRISKSFPLHFFIHRHYSRIFPPARATPASPKSQSTGICPCRKRAQFSPLQDFPKQNQPLAARQPLFST